jgi:hypothetical protein
VGQVVTFDLTPEQYRVIEDMSHHEYDKWLMAGSPDPKPSTNNCAICEERLWTWSNTAEMHDPSSQKSGLVHAECGVGSGWEIS